MYSMFSIVLLDIHVKETWIVLLDIQVKETVDVVSNDPFYDVRFTRIQLCVNLVFLADNLSVIG